MSTRHVRRGAAALAIAMIWLLSACESPTFSRPNFAYDPTGLTNGQLYRWPSGSTVRVWVVRPTADGPDLRQAVQRAIPAWNALPQFAEYRLEEAISLEDAHVVVFDRSTPLPVLPAASCPFDPRGSSGYTYFCPLDGRAARLPTTSGINSRLSVVVRLDIGRTANQSALDAIVAHELGHALGIGGHSTETQDVMFGAPRVATPSARDVMTMRYLLGERPRFTL